MTIAEFLPRLQGVRGHAPRWRSLCPVHQGEGRHSTLTLSVTEGNDGNILLKCFAGCSPEAIVEKLGLAMRDLFAERTGMSTWDQDQADRALRQRGLRPETIAYFHITADLKQQAWAFPLGKDRQRKFKNFTTENGRPKYWSHATLGVYHLAPCRGQAEAWLVEGEPDVWIVHQAGVPAFSLTAGAATPPDEACVAQIRRAGIGVVHVAYDRDDAGREGAGKVAEALAAAGQTVTVRELPSDVGPGGDVTTLYNNLSGDDAAFRAAMAALPMLSVGPETVRARNARIREAALATLREVHQVASWGWSVVDRLLGGVVAGFLYVVGALTGNGKTTFLLNLLSHLLENGVRTLFFGTEMPAEDLLKKWAAFRCGLDEQRVFEGTLDPDQREALQHEIHRLTEQETVTFSTVVQLDLQQLVADVRWAFDGAASLRPEVLVLDHIHELSQDKDELEALTRELKGIARERRVALIVAAQLNRDRNLGLFDDHTPPSLSRFKSSGTIGERADVALGLFKPLRPGITLKQRRAVQQGEYPVTDLAEPDTMAIACLKHRFRGSSKGKFVKLAVRGSKLESPSFVAPPPSKAGDAWEPEEGDRAPF